MLYIAYHPLFEKPIKSRYLDDLKKCIEDVSLLSDDTTNFGYGSIFKLNFLGKECIRYDYLAYHSHWTETPIKTENWFVSLYKYLFNF